MAEACTNDDLTILFLAIKIPNANKTTGDALAANIPIVRLPISGIEMSKTVIIMPMKVPKSKGFSAIDFPNFKILKVPLFLEISNLAMPNVNITNKYPAMCKLNEVP